MSQQNPKSSAQPSASARNPLPADKALAWFGALLRQVAELHRSGRLHGAIASAGATVDAAGRPALGPPAQRVILRSDAPEAYPPELPAGRGWDLPTDLKAARQALTAAGVDVDPRRIDVYQLGVLLCSAISRQPASVYSQPQGTRHGSPGTAASH